MPDGRSIQLYYWAADLVGAKQIVRNGYPSATFSDEAGDASQEIK
jgi:hypothetical protein